MKRASPARVRGVERTGFAVHANWLTQALDIDAKLQASAWPEHTSSA
jgi:hypothetical protein